MEKDLAKLIAIQDFTLRFDEYTEIAGSATVHLWMSCADKNDMDVTVQIRKIDTNGKLLEHLNYPCPVPVEEVPNVNVAKTLGPQGFLRASHAISRDPSQPGIFYKHDRAETIEPGKIVLLEIQLWPMGMVFAANEGIVLKIAGHDMLYPEVGFLQSNEPEDENVGTHQVHTGGQYDSCLTLPIIAPAKS